MPGYSSRTRLRSSLRRCGILLLLLFFLYSAPFPGATHRILAAPRQPFAGVGGCPVFPSDNIWNRDISTLPVYPNSANFIASIGSNAMVHADFGSGLYNGASIGIPYTVVPGSQPGAPVSFQYASESDPGPYPLPAQVPIEGGAQSNGDRHVIVVNSATCKLYELFAAYPQTDGSWKAGSGATWDLNSNALRPASWTSADAAGLSMLAGLARYDEVAAGAITHALRFTVDRTQQAYLWPARHFASASTDPNLPPMGLRLRLKASINVAAFPPQSRIVLTALQHYGMIVADNGSSIFISGAPDDRWDNDDLAHLKMIHASDFEAVDESSLEINPSSAQALASPAPSTPTPIPPTPTPIPTATPSASARISTHQNVVVSLPTLTPIMDNATTDQKKRVASASRPSSQPWSTLTLSLVGGVVALLLLAAVWLRWRRSHRVKRE